MANIKLRSTTSATDPGSTSAKGSALTHAEMDSNLILINNGKLDNITDDFTGTLSVKGSGGSATGAVRFYDNDDSNYLDIKAPATIASNYTLTLPTTDGNANEVLITDGSGNLSWSATYAGDVTSVVAGTGLSGGGTSGAVTVNIDTGTTVDKTTAQTLTNKTLTSPIIGTSIVGGGTNADILVKVNQDGATGNNGPQGNYGWGGGVAHFNSPVTMGTTDTADHGQLFNSGLQITTTHENYATLVLKQKSDSYTFGNVWFVKSNSDTGDEPSDDGETLGGFYASGYNGSNYNQTHGAVYFKVDGDHNGSNFDGNGFAQSGNLGGYIQFDATPNGSQNSVTVCEMYGDHINTNVAIKMGEVSKPSATTDHGYIYVKNDSGTGEVFVLDAADNETKISPHNENGEWEYYSKNTKTGKTVRINMERMVRDLETLTGRKYIENE